jgi:large subunit ribosomal protein L25
LVPEGTHAGLINGGLLSWARHSVKVLAKPGDIPARLVLDISALDIGDTLHVSDLDLPDGVIFSDSVKLTVVTCIAPKGLKADEDTPEGEEGAEPAEAEASAEEEGKPAATS